MEEKKLKFRPSKQVIATMLLLFGFGITQAQQTVTMDEAVAMAVEKHPTIAAADLSIKRSKALKGAAWDFGATQLFTGADEVGNDNNPTYTTIGIGQTNIDVFGIASKSKLARANIKVTETSAELTRLQLERQVKSAWMKSYIAKLQFDSYIEIDSVYSGLNKALDLRFETELISKLEYNILVNQGALIQLEKDKAYSNYQISLQELNNWLLSNKLLEVTLTDLSSFDSTQEISQTTLKNHPLQVYWQNQLAVATAKKKVANAQFMPKLSGQYGFQKIGEQSGFNSYQVGIQIPLIFMKTRAKAKAAKLQEQLVAQENIIKEVQLSSKYNTLVSKYEQLEANWSYYKNNALPLAKEQRNGALLSYKEGAMDYLAFLQNMKAAIVLELESWKALQEYQETKIQLAYFLSE